MYEQTVADSPKLSQKVGDHMKNDAFLDSAILHTTVTRKC